MLKRIVPIMIIVSIVSALFVGCSSSSQQTQTIQITTDNFYNYFAVKTSYTNLSEEKNPIMVGTAFYSTTICDFNVEVYPITSGDYSNVNFSIKCDHPLKWKTRKNDRGYNADDKFSVVVGGIVPTNGSFTESHAIETDIGNQYPNKEPTITLISASGTITQ